VSMVYIVRKKGALCGRVVYYGVNQYGDRITNHYLSRQVVRNKLKRLNTLTVIAKGVRDV